MRCPFCGGTFTLQGPYCPLCGRRIIGRDDRPPATGQPSQSPPLGGHGDDDVLVVDLEPSTASAPPLGPAASPAAQPLLAPAQPHVAEQPVSQEFLGRVCPYCRFPLKQGERMIICPACKVGHHADCWRENGGCTTYGCRYAPQAHPAGQAPPPAAPAAPGPTIQAAVPGPTSYGLPTPAAAAAAARLEARASNALVVSILGLFCFGILSLIGIVLGIDVLARMRALRLNVPGARRKAIGAIVIGVAIILVTLLWIAVAGSLAEQMY